MKHTKHCIFGWRGLDKSSIDLFNLDRFFGAKDIINGSM